MLSHGDNELLTRVGRGTPMGELFRRFWLPAALGSELPAPDCAPLRLRILGEDLVAFRDTTGAVGILEAYCPHKLAPLFFGRNEECGLRCVYHGWKFDVHGNCVDVPNVPNPKDAESLKAKVGVTAYPTCEAGGVIWIYMGPRERLPQLPQFEWAHLPAGYQHVTRWLQRSNYAQGMEGEIDTSHIGFLHSYLSGQRPDNLWRQGVRAVADPAPVLTLRPTDYGLTYGARRTAGSGQYYWRVTQWLMPMYSLIATPIFPFHGRAWVPVDDYHTTTWGILYRTDRPFTAQEHEFIMEGAFFPPRMRAGAVELPHGYVIDTFLPTANRGNDYLIDRQMQRQYNFTGIAGVNEQDRALQENMPGPRAVAGSLVDRSREHLVSSDVPVITVRRLLMDLARDVQRGIEPRPAAEGKLYAVRSLDLLSPIADFDELLRVHAAQARVPLGERPQMAAQSA